ncbi:MAG: hypothetical protein OEY38_23735 [Gammaproteobacteria bacterium]|nr:hypothetical protein [Gammaproteobacteria bacterium]
MTEEIATLSRDEVISKIVKIKFPLYWWHKRESKKKPLNNLVRGDNVEEVEIAAKWAEDEYKVNELTGELAKLSDVKLKQLLIEAENKKKKEIMQFEENKQVWMGNPPIFNVMQ